jgi:glycosyltransferase involved in cell wall biosynthesis
MAQLEPRPPVGIFYAGRRRVAEFDSVFPGQWLRLPTRALEAACVQGPIPIEALIGPKRLVHAPDTVGLRSVAPLVLTVHDLVAFRMPEILPRVYTAERDPGMLVHQRGVRSAIPRARHIICASQATRRDLLQLFEVDPARVSVVHYGVPEPPAGYARAPRGTRRARVLFMGVIEHRKNLPAAVEAVSIIRRQGIDAELVVCGEAHRAETMKIRDECTARGDGWLSWRGRVGAADVWKEYANADALIYPSWYEGFGLPPFEAFKAELPVVAAKTSSLTELLEGAALLCDPGSPAAFADALGRVLSDQKERDRLVRAGRERANRFSWRRAAQETLAVYDRVG